MPFSALLFDMDGVVIDTRQSVIAFWEDLASQHQIQLTKDDYIHHIYGTQAMYTLRKLFPHLSAEQYEAVMVDIVRYENELTAIM